MQYEFFFKVVTTNAIQGVQKNDLYLNWFSSSNLLIYDRVKTASMYHMYVARGSK